MIKINAIAGEGTCRFSFNELAVTRASLLLLMGYKRKAIPRPLPEIIDQAMSLAADYCDIQGGYIIKDQLGFDRNKFILSIGQVPFTLQKMVYSRLKKAEKIAVFVCTAGPEISNWSKKLTAEGDLLKGYIVDTIGSAVVEAALDRIQMTLSDEATASGLKISNRYSPGYCGWDVSEQRKLFSLLPEKFCGIELSAVSLMHPLKSVSGFIGIGENIRYHDYACNICDAPNCLYRSGKSKRL